ELLQVVVDRLAAPQRAGYRRAVLDHVLLVRGALVVRVEREHAEDLRGRDAEQLRDVDHPVLVDAAELALQQAEGRQQRRLALRIARADPLQLLFRGVVELAAHRSSSPAMMLRLDMTATTSLSSPPSV